MASPRRNSSDDLRGHVSSMSSSQSAPRRSSPLRKVTAIHHTPKAARNAVEYPNRGEADPRGLLNDDISDVVGAIYSSKLQSTATSPPRSPVPSSPRKVKIHSKTSLPLPHGDDYPQAWYFDIYEDSVKDTSKASNDNLSNLFREGLRIADISDSSKNLGAAEEGRDAGNKENIGLKATGKIDTGNLRVGERKRVILGELGLEQLTNSGQ